MSALNTTDTKTHCPWKGTASYYTVKVHGTILPVAWSCLLVAADEVVQIRSRKMPHGITLTQ